MRQREKKYDYLRCISCIAIVLLHVSSSYWNVVDTNSGEFIVMTIYNGLTRFAVPVFMMLSGSFLLDTKKDMSIRQCLKRFGKYLFNFYIWSAFFAFQGIAIKFITGKTIEKNLWKESFERFIWGHYHMWFLFLILGFYLILPVIRSITSNKTVTEYYLILWVVTRFLIPAITSTEKLNIINIWIGKLDMNLLIGYLGYFVLGYYIRVYGFSKRIRTILYMGGILGVGYSIIGTIIKSRRMGICYEGYFSPGSWNVLLFSVAIFIFFTYMVKPQKGYSIIKKFSECSFMVYILHPFFIEKLNLIGVTTISFNCLLSIPLLTVVIFLCSFLVAYSIKHIPFLNRLTI